MLTVFVVASVAAFPLTGNTQPMPYGLHRFGSLNYDLSGSRGTPAGTAFLSTLPYPYYAMPETYATTPPIRMMPYKTGYLNYASPPMVSFSGPQVATNNVISSVPVPVAIKKDLSKVVVAVPSAKPEVVESDNLDFLTNVNNDFDALFANPPAAGSNSEEPITPEMIEYAKKHGIPSSFSASSSAGSSSDEPTAEMIEYARKYGIPSLD